MLKKIQLETRRTASEVKVASRFRQRGIVDTNIDAAECNDGSLKGGAESIYIPTVGADLSSRNGCKRTFNHNREMQRRIDNDETTESANAYWANGAPS